LSVSCTVAIVVERLSKHKLQIIGWPFVIVLIITVSAVIAYNVPASALDGLFDSSETDSPSQQAQGIPTESITSTAFVEKQTTDDQGPVHLEAIIFHDVSTDEKLLEFYRALHLFDLYKIRDNLDEKGYDFAITWESPGIESIETIKQFQRDNGLKDDGIIGPATADILFDENHDKYMNPRIIN